MLNQNFLTESCSTNVYFAGDSPSAGQNACSGSTVMYINRGREDEMASQFMDVSSCL